jgi:hypothetical protein
MLTFRNILDMVALAVFAAGVLYGLPVIVEALAGY